MALKQKKEAKPAATATKEPEVLVEPAEPPVPEVVLTTDPPAGTEEAGPTEEQALADLRASLDTEKSARADAERRLTEANHRANQANGEKQASDIALVDTTLGRFKDERTQMQAAYAQALTDGDHVKAAQINTDIADRTHDIKVLEAGKVALDAQAKQPVKPAQVADAVEAFAATLSPRSAAWVRQHPDYARNEKLNKKMTAAHYKAVADDHVPDTDAYFAAIEKDLGIGQKDPEAGGAEPALSVAAEPVQRRGAPPAAAPVTRTNTPGVRSNKFTMTPEMREAARSSGLSDEEYARNHLALQKEGRLTTH